MYTYVKINRKVSIKNVDTQTNQKPPASGAHGTCPACHTLDTPLVHRYTCTSISILH
jgi:hypothetical protein